MKKLLALLIVIVVLSSIPLVAASRSKSVECKVFYIYEEEFVKPDGLGKPAKPPKPEPEPDEPQLYELMGVKWRTLGLNYVIDPVNDVGLGETEIISTIYASAETWDDASSAELFSDAYAIQSARGQERWHQYWMQSFVYQ